MIVHICGLANMLLGERVREHAYKGTNSAVSEHCRRNKHLITPAGRVKIPDTQVTVLHQEPDYIKRGVAESISIMLEEPTLNRDKGRHTLPEIYRELLTRDRSGHVVSQRRCQGRQST